MWSSYTMKQKGMVTKVVPVLKQDGEFIRNPLVITDKWIEDGEVVYGQFKRGEEAANAKGVLKSSEYDFSLLDKEVDKIVWTFTNLFPGCLMKSIDGIRQKKRFFWDMTKHEHRHWLAANMQGEAFLGFNAFNSKKITGKDVVDFIEYRRQLASGAKMDESLYEAVLGQPQGE